MLEWLIENKSNDYNIAGVFANTSWEHYETLAFVDKCTERWKEKYNFSLVWVEADIKEMGVGTKHKKVNYTTCKKDMEIFQQLASKYGLPNAGLPFCTRELKENPIHHYVKDVLGWSNNKGSSQPYQTALGIRIDEPKRLKRTDAHKQNKVYPLVDWHREQPDKLDIIDWWEEQEFDLGIPEHLGNCVGCYKKSKKKLLKALRDAPYQFINDLEKRYGYIGNNRINGELTTEPRTMYRNYETCDDLIKTLDITPPSYLNGVEYEGDNEGCASSCEPFAVENYPQKQLNFEWKQGELNV